MLESVIGGVVIERRSRLAELEDGLSVVLGHGFESDTHPGCDVPVGVAGPSDDAFGLYGSPARQDEIQGHLRSRRLRLGSRNENPASRNIPRKPGIKKPFAQHTAVDLC